MTSDDVRSEGRDPETGQFLKGYRGGPGRSKGSRNKLGEAFIEAMHDDFVKHGVAVIETVRTEKPDQYLKVIAGILPKELNVNARVIDDMPDDELVDALDTIRSLLSVGHRGEAGQGSRKAARAKEAGKLSH